MGGVERAINDDVRVLDDTAANLVPNWKARDMMANMLAMMVRPIR